MLVRAFGGIKHRLWANSKMIFLFVGGCLRETYREPFSSEHFGLSKLRQVQVLALDVTFLWTQLGPLQRSFDEQFGAAGFSLREDGRG